MLQYIDANYTDTISLDSLSAHCFLNKSYLCRLFKRETGFHIHDYIVYRRLSHGMLLLRSGRQQLGITPYQYAKKFKGSPKR